MVFSSLLCQMILSYVGESAFWGSFLCLEIHQIFNTLEIEASIFCKSTLFCSISTWMHESF